MGYDTERNENEVGNTRGGRVESGISQDGDRKLVRPGVRDRTPVRVETPSEWASERTCWNTG